MRRHVARLVLLLLALVASRPCAAQTDKAAAEALFREGMRLEKAGKFAEACPKLEESMRQEPSLGTQYYLADCYDHVGRTASAWANFTEVADKSRLAGETAKEEVARKRAGELEPKLSHLTVQVDGAVPGLTLKRGDNVVGSGQWGVAVPVDPGKYVLVASAPGYAEWKQEIAVEPASAATAQVPGLQPLPPERSAVTAPPSPGPAAPTDTSVSAQPRSSHAQRTVGIVLAATGVVALGAGGVFGLMAKGANDDSNAPGKCRGDSCSRAGLDDRDRAVTFADVATITSIAGGLLLATGSVLWLTAPKHTETPPVAELGVGPGSLLLRGQF